MKGWWWVGYTGSMEKFSGKQFTWCKGVGYVDASSLTSGRLPDAFVVKSHRTGREQVFRYVWSDGRGAVAESWTYASARGIKIKVWND